jgi:hypothetical protein
MVQADPYLQDEKLARLAKVFPSMCKPDAETQPKKSTRPPPHCQRNHPTSDANGKAALRQIVA